MTAAADLTAEGGQHKLWGGRFKGGPSPLLEALNRSITTDFRLWPHDVRLSKAWAVALWNAGIEIWDVGGGGHGGTPSAPVVLGAIATIGTCSRREGSLSAGPRVITAAPQLRADWR